MRKLVFDRDPVVVQGEHRSLVLVIELVDEDEHRRPRRALGHGELAGISVSAPQGDATLEDDAARADTDGEPVHGLAQRRAVRTHRGVQPDGGETLDHGELTRTGQDTVRIRRGEEEASFFIRHERSGTAGENEERTEKKQ